MSTCMWMRKKVSECSVRVERYTSIFQWPWGRGVNFKIPHRLILKFSHSKTWVSTPSTLPVGRRQYLITIKMMSTNLYFVGFFLWWTADLFYHVHCFSLHTFWNCAGYKLKNKKNNCSLQHVCVLQVNFFIRAEGEYDAWCSICVPPLLWPHSISLEGHQLHTFTTPPLLIVLLLFLVRWGSIV